MVSTAAASGRITTSSNAVVITSTARLRRPHNRLCAISISGHVETTISVDQMSAGMNGRRIHRLATMPSAMKRMASRKRGNSRKAGTFVMGVLV
jgi:hypothetical protein